MSGKSLTIVIKEIVPEVETGYKSIQLRIEHYRKTLKQSKTFQRRKKISNLIHKNVTSQKQFHAI